MTDKDVKPCTHKIWFRCGGFCAGLMECLNCGYTLTETRHAKFPNRKILSPSEKKEIFNKMEQQGEQKWMDPQ